MRHFFSILTFALATCASVSTQAGERYNFNAEWRLSLGDDSSKAAVKADDSDWQKVTLPYAFNQHEAFAKSCGLLSDTVMWYRKHFVLPESSRKGRVFVEFEGVRFGAQVFVNGHELGWGENGIMAFGFDITPYIKTKGENVIAVRVDNDWEYREHFHPYTNEKGQQVYSKFQWNSKNFFCNYGGINKNVWLHVMGDVYQTLPLYSNLRTVGPYVYAKDIVVDGGKATVCAETQVVNSAKKAREVQYRVTVLDNEGKQVASFLGDKKRIEAGDTVTLKASKAMAGLKLWSWGYGYLYTVKSELLSGGEVIDAQDVVTGFRKTEFKNGMFYLNDRVLQLKGFAQRSTNEWPAVGISLPAWMTDYSNSLILGCNGNLVRWMHVTPSKQDIRSFDRLGLIQAMPAGDAEKDVEGRRWEQRCEVMRDAIIYNRNNPSIIFYEGGNNQISEEHMADLKSIRDMYDPHGGRASGSRNMLDSKIAEYGGEMLYVNTSAGKPMWQMEYNRDEGIRRYWDQWSYPYHIEGDGPLYRGDRAVAYNHNQDGLAVENIVRWNEYWLARPGTGKRVNSGGAKIIFSDSNTHARGEKSYRTSGVTDAMRIPKDSWFVHRVMWDGWVDIERDGAYIIGHWNYEDGDAKGNAVVKPVYVASTGDEVELFLNGKSLGKGERSETFLFTWKSVPFEPGTLKAVAYKQGKAVAEHQIKSAGKPVALRMKWVDAPETMRADGSDIRIAEIEAVDANGMRHPLAHDMIHFSVEGNGTYLGGVSGMVTPEDQAEFQRQQATGQGGIVTSGFHSADTNGVGSPDIALEAGVMRVMVRSTTDAGKITLRATSSAYPTQSISVSTTAAPVKNGFYVDAKGNAIEADWAKELPAYLKRGATPTTPSYTQKYRTVDIASVETAANAKDVANLYDDNEASKWKSDGLLQNAWVKVKLARKANIRQVVLRMDGFRSTSYPLEIWADGKLVFSGYTPKNLGHCYLNFTETVNTDQYEIRMIGEATVKEAFGSMTELAAKKKVSTKASKSNTLSIIEMAFNE